jgi:energy-coupling factor transporter transmembrane protein EcfT
MPFAFKVPAEIKIAIYLFFVISLFIVQSLEFYALALVFVVLFFISIPFASLKRGWVSAGLLLLFTFLSNVFFSYGAVIFNAGSFLITDEGLRTAMIRTMRIFFMLAGAKILTASLPLVEIIKAFSNMLKPLEKTGLPVYDFFSTMGLTLKCFPALKNYLAEHYEKNTAPEKVKGFLAKAKIVSALILPMLIQSINAPEIFFKEEQTGSANN